MLGRYLSGYLRNGVSASLFGGARTYATAVPKVEIELRAKEDQTELPADAGSIPFGTVFSDHMLTYEWTADKGWSDTAYIKPYGPLSLMPSCNVFHYGQEVFEGMKAYTTAEGENQLFRPSRNFERFGLSCDRLRLPVLPVESGLHCLQELLKVDRKFIPSQPGTSLYIRPTMIATEACLGVKAASQALFFLIFSPVGAYYQGGAFEPLRIWICDEYSRAAPKGTGEAKAGGNYAASIIGSEKARDHGCVQALWLDALEGKYVEEVGAMNMFFVFKNGDELEITTPPLGGTILAGITRNSILQLVPTLNPKWKAVERMVSVDEIIERIQDGSCVDAFGAGTAAAISPVGTFVYKNEEHTIKGDQALQVSKTMYDTLTGIQYGRLPDPFNWTAKF